MIPNPNHMPDETDTEAFVAAVKRGLASADAGRTVPYEDVRKWLLSWGTKDELPKPECR
jgi:predicted transcriptional regulator